DAAEVGLFLIAAVQSIELACGLALLGQVGHLRSAELHPGRELVGFDAGRQVGVAGMGSSILRIEFCQKLKTRPLPIGVVIGRRSEIENGLAFAAEDRPLVLGW